MAKEKKTTKKGNARKGQPAGSRLAYDDTKQSKRGRGRPKGAKNKKAAVKKEPVKRGRGRPKGAKNKKGMETIKLRKSKGAKENADITFKKGGLHRSLKVPSSYTFKKSELRALKRYKVGDSFVFHDKTIKMTEKIKRQIDLGLTLMGFHKK